MTRKEMLAKNQQEFSRLRKWMMDESYHTKQKKETNLTGVAIASIVGTTMVANASSFGTVPTHTGAVIAGAIMAKSTKAGSFIGTILYMGNIHKLPIKVAFKLGDKARNIFNKTMDQLLKVPVHVVAARDLEFGLSKIKFQSDSMFGIALNKKDQFIPNANIYLPVTLLEKDSPLFAKNKQIFKEIVEMIDSGVLSKDDAIELDKYTKGVTKFSTDVSNNILGDSRFDKTVNYAVLAPKLEKILDALYSIQFERESLRVDLKLTKKIKPEFQPSDIKSSLPSINDSLQALNEQVGELKTTISELKESVFSNVQKQFVSEEKTSEEKAIEIVENGIKNKPYKGIDDYPPLDNDNLKKEISIYNKERGLAKKNENIQKYNEYNRKLMDAHTINFGGVTREGVEKSLQGKKISPEGAATYVKACMENAQMLEKIGILKNMGGDQYKFVSENSKIILNASIGEPYDKIEAKITNMALSRMSDYIDKGISGKTLEDVVTKMNSKKPEIKGPQ